MMLQVRILLFGFFIATVGSSQVQADMLAQGFPEAPTLDGSAPSKSPPVECNLPCQIAGGGGGGLPPGPGGGVNTEKPPETFDFNGIELGGKTPAAQDLWNQAKPFKIDKMQQLQKLQQY